MINKLFIFLKQRAAIIDIRGILLALLYSDSKKLIPSDILFLCHDNSRYTKVEGLRYAPLIDTIIDDLDKDITHITLILPFSKYFGDSCHGNVVMFNRIFLWSFLLRFFWNKGSFIKDTSTDYVIKAFKKILKKIKPKIIIAINPSPELCIAAKELGIWTADIQHGIIAPGNYYDFEKRSRINQQGWPDVILCWDQYSMDFVTSNIGDYVQAKVIGHPALASKASKKLFTGSNEPGYKMAILLTTIAFCPESHTHDSNFKNIGIQKSMIDFIKAYGSAYDWHIRLHPALMMNSKTKIYKQLSIIFEDHPNVTWDVPSNGTFLSALEKCSAHITFNSASAREAAIRGIRTAILDTDKDVVNLYFNDLIQEGLVVMLKPEEHLSFEKWLLSCKIDRENNKRNSLDIQYTTEFESFINDLNFKAKKVN